MLYLLTSIHLLNPGIKPGFPALQADSLPTELPGKPHGYLVGKPRSDSLGLVCKVGKVAVMPVSEMFADSWTDIHYCLISIAVEDSSFLCFFKSLLSFKTLTYAPLHQWVLVIPAYLFCLLIYLVNVY